MYKVLICDDERKVCQLLTKLIDWNGLSLELCGTAYNAPMALELIRENVPDIVITDINMPGGNGLDLIRDIKEQHPTVNFIVISGYNDFSYAQTAIRYGVENYLLKPVNQTELINTLKGILEKLNNFRMAQEMTRAMKTQLEVSSANLQAGFLPALLALNEPMPLQEARERYLASLEKDCFQLLLVRACFPYTQAKQVSSEFLHKKMLFAVEQSVKNMFAEVYCANTNNGIYVLINDDPAGLEKIPDACNQILQALRLLYDIFPKISPAIGISSVGKDFEKCNDLIYESTVAAYSHLLSEKSSPLIHFKDSMVSDYSFSPDYAEFDQAVEYMNIEKTEALLKQFHVKIFSETRSGLRSFAAYRRIFRRFQIVAEKNNLPLDGMTVDTYRDLARKCATLDDIFCALSDMITEKLEEIRKQRSNATDASITEIQDYIQKNYSQKIKLDELGEVFGYNSVYLSASFKQKTGKTLSDYLLEIRMEEAKRRLQNTMDAIADVAPAVGYADLKYFTKVFKNYTGISPKEYRKLYHI